jgi:hypothetical protein
VYSPRRNGYSAGRPRVPAIFFAFFRVSGAAAAPAGFADFQIIA